MHNGMASLKFIASQARSNHQYKNLKTEVLKFCAKYHLIVIIASCLIYVVYWRYIIYYTDMYDIYLLLCVRY